MTIDKRGSPTAALLLVLLPLTGCTRPEEDTPDHPRMLPDVTMRDVVFHSAALGRDMRYRVLLPASIKPGWKLPAVYLLHGIGGDFREWSNDSDVARYARDGLVLVMPQGDFSYYVNAAERPSDRYEDYIVRDLIADVENRFPVAATRGKRAIVGISMGGYGSVRIALSHPDLFVFAGSLSGALDAPRRPLSFRRPRQFWRFFSLFGPRSGETQRSNDPFLIAESADRATAPYLFLSCGDAEALLPVNREFAALLTKRDFPHEFHVARGGHDWNQWAAQLPSLFASLSRHLDGR